MMRDARTMEEVESSFMLIGGVGSWERCENA
jgi:hypothetical protein